MNSTNLKNLKKKISKLSNIYNILVDEWNGPLKDGNNAIYPVTVIIGVLLHNMAFDGSDCVNYSHDKAVEDLHKSYNTLKALNDFHEKTYMVHYPFTEVSFLIEGVEMEALYNELDNDNIFKF